MQAVVRVYLLVVSWVDAWGQSALALAFRLWLAKVFFMSGLTKIKSWDTTLSLFEWEYAVPLIPPVPAAYLATGAELLLPVMLVLGLGSRFAAAGLFVVNWVALISYPDISPAGINDHYFWGAMALVLAVYGGGKLSLDRWIGHLVTRDKPQPVARPVLA